MINTDSQVGTQETQPPLRPKTNLDLFTGAADTNYFVTNFSMDVARNFISETYSISNTYTLNFQGFITDLPSARSEIISTGIKTRIQTLFDDSKFDYRVKSLTFPSDSGNTADLSKTAKFAISFEIRERDPLAHTNFVGTNAMPTVDKVKFNKLLPPNTINDFGASIKDISESFNIDDSNDGKCTFNHSINFTLMPFPNVDVILPPPAVPPARSAQGTGPGLNIAAYFRERAQALVASLTSYATFITLTEIFTSPTVASKQSLSKFPINFFTQNNTFTHSETFDLFNFTYSLTRTKSFNKDNSQPPASFSHSYNLVVNEEGIIDVTEETKIEGKTKNILDIKDFISNHIDKAAANVAGYGDTNNTYSGVKESYTRCQLFLQNYKRLLRYNTANASIGPSGYSSKTGVDSLRPIAMEKNLTYIPGSPSAVYSVKYTNNPNVNFGYECDESIKADASNGIINVVHSMNVKTFKFKDARISGFDTALGSNSNGATYAAFRDAKITSSRLKMNTIISTTQPAPSAPYLPIPFLVGMFRGLAKDPDTTKLALIKKSSNVSERGKSFSLTLTYNSNNKYGPLLYSQTTPPVAVMFTNLGVPTSAHVFLKDNFCTFDMKVSSKLPVEKFTQKVIVQKANTTIEPSFSTSIGTFSINFSGKLKRSIFGFARTDNGVLGNEIVNATVLANLKKIVDNVRSKVVPPPLASLKVIIQGIIERYLKVGPATDASGIIKAGVTLGGVNWIPTSVSYKYNSNLDFEMTVDLEFYIKKTTPGVVFYYKDNSFS